MTPPHHNQRGGGRPVCNCTLAPGKWDQESRKLGMMALQPGENPPVDAKRIIFRTVLKGFGGRQNDLMVLVPLNNQDTVTNLSSSSRI